MPSIERLEHQPRLTCGGPLSPRRLWHVAVGCGVYVLLFAATLIYGGPAYGARLLSANNDDVVEPAAPDSGKEAPPKPEPEFYDWHTRSQFRPVSQAVARKSVQDLCNAFPKDLLRDVQPVLKSGHGVLEKRVKTQLESVSACLDDHLLIFSDMDEEIDGYQVIDALADLRSDFVSGNDQLQDYVLQRELADNGTLHTEAGSKVKGWLAHPTDKCRRLVEREFNIMRGLSYLDAVARVGGEPLTDQDGIFGFRLERLYRVELEDLQQRIQEVRKLLESLHGAGYCHGDYSFSNIMQNQEERLVLIDLAFAGPLGSQIPENFPKHLLPGGRYNTNIDQERMERWGKFRS